MGEISRVKGDCCCRMVLVMSGKHANEQVSCYKKFVILTSYENVIVICTPKIENSFQKADVRATLPYQMIHTPYLAVYNGFKELSSQSVAIVSLYKIIIQILL